MRLSSIVFGLLVSLSPALASAERVELLPSAPAAETRTEYHGGIIIAADVVSVALAAGIEDSEGYMLVPLTTYLIVGPVTHLAHDRPGAAFGSLALRGGLPIMGAAVGVGLESCTEEEFMCGLAGMFVGAMVGAGTAMVIDWTLLSHHTVEVAPRPRKSVFTAMPDVSVSRDGDVRVGLLGTF